MSDQLTLGRDPGPAAEPWIKPLGQCHAAFLGLAVLEDRDQAAAHGKSRAVQRVHELRFAIRVG